MTPSEASADAEILHLSGLGAVALGYHPYLNQPSLSLIS